MSYWTEDFQWAVEAEARFDQAFGLGALDQPGVAQTHATATRPRDDGPSRSWRFPEHVEAARKRNRVNGETQPAQEPCLRLGGRTIRQNDFRTATDEGQTILASPVGQDPFMPTPRNTRIPSMEGGLFPQAGQVPAQTSRPPMIGQLKSTSVFQPPTMHGHQSPQAMQPIVPAVLTPPLAQPMLALPPPATTLLQVLKGRKGTSNVTGSPFALFQQNRPPYNVQPPLGVDIGMCEICVFMPDWLHIVEVVIRFLRNGANRAVLAKMQLLATGELTDENFLRCKNKIQQQLGECGKLYYRINRWNVEHARKEGAQDDLTADSWATHRKGKDVEFKHIKLVDIYSAVPVANFPTGKDRLLLTQCLEYARNNPHLDLDTSHFDWIIQSQGLQAPAVPVQLNRDQETMADFDEPDP